MDLTDGKLFSAFSVGELQLQNRIAMAPMTRDRAGADGVPGDLMELYYSQRASAGLIITEGTPPDAMGQGYLRVPGLYTDEQVAGWRKVTDAVHAGGAKIFAQLMYVGRASHPSFLGGATPVGPSAVKPEGTVYTESGLQPFVTPRALEAAEIPAIVETYRRAAELAETAGFDGVELHGTAGYLPHQFLAPNANLRTDEWGGPVAHRCRFLLAVVDAMASVRGAGRVGVRIGPAMTFNDVHDPDPQDTYGYLCDRLGERGIAYLHLLNIPADWDVLGFVRARFPGVLIANGGYDRDRAEAELEAGKAEMISFGSSFLANPDLPERLRRRAALNVPDKNTFYTDGAAGYVDYPFLSA